MKQTMAVKKYHFRWRKRPLSGLPVLIHLCKWKHMLPTHFPGDGVQTIKRLRENEMCQSSYVATPPYAGPLHRDFYETQNSFLGVMLKSIANVKICQTLQMRDFIYLFGPWKLYLKPSLWANSCITWSFVLRDRWGEGKWWNKCLKLDWMFVLQS